MSVLPLEAQCTHRAPLRAESRRRMTVVLVITAAVMLLEAVGGWLAHSLALLADAGHMLADAAALGLSLLVAYLAQRPATAERTFGLLRLEILAALARAGRGGAAARHRGGGPRRQPSGRRRAAPRAPALAQRARSLPPRRQRRPRVARRPRGRRGHPGDRLGRRRPAHLALY